MLLSCDCSVPTVWWISLQTRSEFWLKRTVCSRCAYFDVTLASSFNQISQNFTRIIKKAKIFFNSTKSLNVLLCVGWWWAVLQWCLQQWTTNRGNKKSQSAMGCVRLIRLISYCRRWSQTPASISGYVFSWQVNVLEEHCGGRTCCYWLRKWASSPHAWSQPVSSLLTTKNWKTFWVWYYFRFYLWLFIYFC